MLLRTLFSVSYITSMFSLQTRSFFFVLILSFLPLLCLPNYQYTPLFLISSSLLPSTCLLPCRRGGRKRDRPLFGKRSLLLTLWSPLFNAWFLKSAKSCSLYPPYISRLVYLPQSPLRLCLHLPVIPHVLHSLF